MAVENDKNPGSESGSNGGQGHVAVIPYPKQLDQNPRWALSESSLFFEDKGAVQEALRKITKRLSDLGIPYTVAGGLALFHHGYRRFTEDVDLLVTRQGLREIHEQLEGLGYVPPFAKSKNLRDTELGVKIDFLVTGEFPGDGKPKPVAFPDPIAASFEVDGIRYLNLNRLVELKLASGMTSLGRAKDLADVLELIKAINLPQTFVESLDPYVREKFNELWQSGRRRFVRIWRNKFLTTHVNSLPEMIEGLRTAALELEAMRADGVVLDPKRGTGDDYALLVTSDPKIAEKYGMEDESELWADDGDENNAPPSPAT